MLTLVPRLKVFVQFLHLKLLIPLSKIVLDKIPYTQPTLKEGEFHLLPVPPRLRRGVYIIYLEFRMRALSFLLCVLIYPIIYLY